MVAYLLNAFQGPGAPFMWVITAVMAFAIAIVLERSWVLFHTCRIDMARLRGALEGDDREEVLQAAGRSPLRAVLESGLNAPSPEAAWEAMGAEAVDAESSLFRRIPYLATIGNVATMLGLLGTVYGLIVAFSALGDATAAERALRLSDGISTAMATTAYGLVVGIPSLTAHAWLDSRARAILGALEATAGRLAASLRS